MSPIRFLIRIALIGFVVLCATVLSRSLSAQTPSAGFIIKKGNDTVAVESYSRDATTLTSEIYQSNGLRTQFTMTLRPDSSVQYVELTRQGRQGQGVGLNVAFGDTIVTAAITAPGGNEKLEIPLKARATPFLAVSFALCDQILRANHLEVGHSRTLTAVRLGLGDTTTLTLARFHADSVLFTMPDVQIKVALSPAGEVIGGRHLGQDWLIERRVGR